MAWRARDTLLFAAVGRQSMTDAASSLDNPPTPASITASRCRLDSDFMARTVSLSSIAHICSLRGAGIRSAACSSHGDESVATFRLATAECARFPEIGRAIYNSGVRQNFRRMAEFLAHVKDAGQLRSDADVNVAAEQFLDLCLAGIHRRRLWNISGVPSGEEIRTNVANAVTTFMRAFGA
jgi:hypothetical protein